MSHEDSLGSDETSRSSSREGGSSLLCIILVVAGGLVGLGGIVALCVCLATSACSSSTSSPGGGPAPHGSLPGGSAPDPPPHDPAPSGLETSLGRLEFQLQRTSGYAKQDFGESAMLKDLAAILNDRDATHKKLHPNNDAQKPVEAPKPSRTYFSRSAGGGPAGYFISWTAEVSGIFQADDTGIPVGANQQIPEPTAYGLASNTKGAMYQRAMNAAKTLPDLGSACRRHQRMVWMPKTTPAGGHNDAAFLKEAVVAITQLKMRLVKYRVVTTDQGTAWKSDAASTGGGTDFRILGGDTEVAIDETNVEEALKDWANPQGWDESRDRWRLTFEGRRNERARSPERLGQSAMVG